jgi:hypothetical protein
MNWREQLVFMVFGRVMVARWVRRITTAGFIAMVIFAFSGAIEQLGYIRDRLAGPLTLCYLGLRSFALAVCSAVVGAYATHRRISR